MKRILITGATGFTGTALCSQLKSKNKVIGIYHRKRPVDHAKITWEQADPPASPERERWRAGLTDLNTVAAICEKHSPDVVIHCAGIAHQKIGAVDSVTYIRVNIDD